MSEGATNNSISYPGIGAPWCTTTGGCAGIRSRKRRRNSRIPRRLNIWLLYLYEHDYPHRFHKPEDSNPLLLDNPEPLQPGCRCRRTKLPYRGDSVYARIPVTKLIVWFARSLKPSSRLLPLVIRNEGQLPVAGAHIPSGGKLETNEPALLTIDTAKTIPSFAYTVLYPLIRIRRG